MPFDILTGSDRARVAIDAGLTTTGLEELCEVGTGVRDVPAVHVDFGGKRRGLAC